MGGKIPDINESRTYCRACESMSTMPRWALLEMIDNTERRLAVEKARREPTCPGLFKEDVR